MDVYGNERDFVLRDNLCFYNKEISLIKVYLYLCSYSQMFDT